MGVVVSAITSMLLGSALLWVWIIVWGSPTDLLAGARRAMNLVGGLEFSEVFTVLGSLAAVAVAVTIASSEMATRVDLLDTRTRAADVAELTDVQAVSAARLRLAMLAALAAFGQAIGLGLSILLATGDSATRVLALPVSILLTGYLLVQLSSALAMLLQLAWLDPKVRQAQSVDVVGRVSSRPPSDRSAARVAWAAWCAASTLPLTFLGLAVDGVPGALLALVVSALVVPLVRAGLITFGRGVLVEVGAVRTFTWVATGGFAVAMLLLEGLLVFATLGGTFGLPGSGRWVVSSALAVVVLARCATMLALALGLDGLGPMAPVVWREIEYVTRSVEHGTRSDVVDGAPAPQCRAALAPSPASSVRLASPLPPPPPPPALLPPHAPPPPHAVSDVTPAAAGSPALASSVRLWVGFGAAVLWAPAMLFWTGHRDEALLLVVVVVICLAVARALALPSPGAIGEELPVQPGFVRTSLTTACAVGSGVVACSAVLSLDGAGGTEQLALLGVGALPSVLATILLCLGLVGRGPLAHAATILRERRGASDGGIVSLVADSQLGASRDGLDPPAARGVAPVRGLCDVPGCAGPSVSA